MKKNVLPIVAAAMALTFTACQPADKVAPAVTTTDTDATPDELVSAVVNYVAAPGNTSLNSSLAKAQARTVKPSSAQIKAAFDAFDGDRSGQIAATELLQVLASFLDFVSLSLDKKEEKLLKQLDKEYKLVITEEQARQLIKMFDANNSGMMEFNEFEKLIEEVLKNGK